MDSRDFSNCGNIETFSIMYYYPNDNNEWIKYIRKYRDLKQGLCFIFSLKAVLKQFFNTEFKNIRVFNRDAKPIEIVNGSIDEIYQLYLKTYSKASEIDFHEITVKINEVAKLRHLENMCNEIVNAEIFK